MKKIQALRQREMRLREELPAANGFRPNRLVRGPRVQTIASSYAMRGLGKVLAGEQMVVVDAGEDETGYEAGARLFGFYNAHEAEGSSKGLVISLHGWEGHSHSVYNLLLGSRLLAEGYDLFRLNLRDHGPALGLDPYGLNRGLFLGTLVAEAHRAVQHVAEWAGNGPVFLIGPSLGGNFVLRMAALHTTSPIANLRRVVAISPAINPATATDRIDAQYPFRRYFRERWLRSVQIKAQRFPDLYSFAPLAQIPRIRDMTEWLVRHYSDFDGADDYFARYTVTADSLRGLRVPTIIVTAADDPVIRVQEIELLRGPSHDPSLLDLKIERFGGHVGFVDLWPLRPLLPEMVLAELERE